MKKSMPFEVRDCVSSLRENWNQEDNEKRGTFPKVRKFPSDQIDLSVYTNISTDFLSQSNFLFVVDHKTVCLSLGFSIIIR